MNTLDYAVSDPAAVRPDETLLAEIDTPARKGRGCLPALSIFLVSLIFAGVILWVCMSIGTHASTIVAVVGVMMCISLGIVIANDWLKSTKQTLVRITDQRLVHKTGDVVVQQGLRELTTFERRRKAGQTRIRFEAERNEDDEFGTEAIELSGATFNVAPSSAHHDAVVMALNLGAGLRAQERAARRAWRPMMPEMETDWPTTIARVREDERVLWTGSPHVDARLDVRRAAKGALFALPRALVAAALTALPIAFESFRNGGFVFLSVIGAIWLFAALNGMFVKPFREVSRRKRTRYVLTNLRAIVVVCERTGEREVSRFLDAQDDADLTIGADGRGSVRFGFTATFEDLAEPRGAYEVLMRAIAGARNAPIEAQTVRPAAPIGDNGGRRDETEAGEGRQDVIGLPRDP